MKLIVTNDGMMGWVVNGKMIWCSDRSELDSIGWSNVARMYGINQMQRHEFIKEVDYAIDHMAKSNHSVAHFGVMGTFIYSEKEIDNDGF